ncbi:MAG: hypothetical protein DBX47_00770 [Clostridiales bacterium]|nr:MAG: hypothetical protein DBX47_00770 [Clostridiales bacterium]
MNDIQSIIEKFAESGWDLIAAPAQEWLDGKKNKEELISAVKKADEECGSCGCEFDELYKFVLANSDLI